MIALIAHTEPEPNIASKNQDVQEDIPNISCTGEYRTIDKNHPQWNPKHIIHLIASLTKIKNPRKGNPGVFEALLIAVLGPLKMLP